MENFIFISCIKMSLKFFNDIIINNFSDTTHTYYNLLKKKIVVSAVCYVC